jgi:3-hydroxyisobutyrate dehydrogenase-like beta-hydroxyacid dehydrogenase
MGGSIARHLITAGYEAVGYDPDPDAMRAAASAGVGQAADVGDLAGRCAVLITSLPSAGALDAVAAELREAPGGLKYLIETSTLSAEQKQQARDWLRPTGIGVLDCPISGTSAQLRGRDAVVYASGDTGELESCWPVLESFSRLVVQTGDFGNGSRLKLVANLLVAVHNAAAAEAIALATSCGLSPGLVLTALTSGSGSSRMLELRGPMMIERRYSPPAMRLELFDKDLKLIESLARHSGASTPLFAASAELYAAAARAGHGAEDTASVLEALLPSAPPDGQLTA